MHGRGSAVVWTVMVAIAAALLSAANASAAQFQVNTTADPQGNPPCNAIQCTLRAALQAAQANTDGLPDSVFVPTGDYTLSQGQIAIGPASDAQQIVIVGAGADATVVHAGNTSRVFSLGANANVSFLSLTMRDGNAGQGGNLLVGNDASASLSFVRITEATATSGGGIAVQQGSLTIAWSVVDHNEAQDGEGGGILIQGAGGTNASDVEVFDSTVAFNTGFGGAGIASTHAENTLDVEYATIAANTGGGIELALGSALAHVNASIVSGNQDNGSPSNCGGATPDEQTGGNLESGTDCGFDRLDDRQNADPSLSGALLDQGGHTLVLTIPSTSPAVNLVPQCVAQVDQRFYSRGQNFTPCDSGAYEHDGVPPGGETQPPPAPQPTTPVATPTPAPPPTPQFHQTVVVKPVSGKILVRRPGSKDFVELDATQGVPLGSTLDTKDGVLELSSVPKPGAAPQKARFFEGIFKVTQTGATTDLTLNEPLAACKSGRAGAAAKKPKTRRLWGDGSGSFRTRGQYSAATVRGTKWLVQDSCAGTLTRVTRGVVSVRDNVRRKTILLRAGKRYLARPRR